MQKRVLFLRGRCHCLAEWGRAKNVFFAWMQHGSNANAARFDWLETFSFGVRTSLRASRPIGREPSTSQGTLTPSVSKFRPFQVWKFVRKWLHRRRGWGWSRRFRSLSSFTATSSDWTGVSTSRTFYLSWATRRSADSGSIKFSKFFNGRSSIRPSWRSLFSKRPSK